MKHSISILLLFISASAAVAQRPFNQDPGNPNLDFSSGNFSSWQLSWGSRGNPYTYSGTIAGGNSHTLVDIYGTNWDGNAGSGQLKRVPDGLDRVVRLGDPAGGGYGAAKSYAMRYDIRVHADFPILFFQLAAIMDKTHTASDNTYYKFSIRDSNGNYLISPPCGGLSMSPRGLTSGGSNIITTPAIPYSLLPEIGSIAYQPWQSVALDVSSYAGQTLTIAYEHNDCYTGHHGSYTYLSAAMRSASDTFYFCRGAATTTLKPYHPHFSAYLWNTGATTDSLTVSNPADGASYTCRVTSYNGCSAVFTYVLKEVRTEAGFTFTPTGQCNQVGFSDRSVTNYGTIRSRVWDFGDPASGQSNHDTRPDPVHTYPRPGYYTVTLTVTDAGCSHTTRKEIHVSPEGTLAQLKLPATACAGDTLTLEDITENSLSRIWLLDSKLLPETSRILRIAVPQPGTNAITLIATGSNGCPDTLRQSIAVHGLPQAAITVTPLTLAAPVTQPEFTFKAVAPAAIRYEWDFGYNGLTAGEQYGSCIYPPAVAAYRVRLGVYDRNGCYNTTSVTVHVRPPDLMMPNAFSPNGDGLNDQFGPVNVTNQAVKEFSIFNRYGQRVFYTLHPETGWDGNYRQQACDAGVYYYIIRYSVPGSDEEYNLKGEVMLVR